MAVLFTSDTHFNDPRLDIFCRPFKSVKESNDIIIKNWNNLVKKDDIVWHLGDFSKDEKGYEFVKKLNGKINLILGNYDEDNLKDFAIFNSVSKNAIVPIKGIPYYLTHKPEDARKDMFNLVGHIHRLWVVQRNMINVGTDAWHFLPVTEDQIQLQYNGIKNHYDHNVFINEQYSKIGRDVVAVFKKAFNKENPSELLSQIIKVISKDYEGDKLDQILNKIKDVGKEVITLKRKHI